LSRGSGRLRVVASIPTGLWVAAGSWMVISRASVPTARRSRAFCSSPPGSANSSTRGTIGLRGTGSHDFAVGNVFVPAHSLSFREPPVEPGPLYALPTIAMLGMLKPYLREQCGPYDSVHLWITVIRIHTAPPRRHDGRHRRGGCNVHAVELCKASNPLPAIRHAGARRRCRQHRPAAGAQCG